MGILDASVALGLTDIGAEVFTSMGVELLEREILLEPLADHIGPTVASLLATL